jgi:hypothetical protein
LLFISLFVTWLVARKRLAKKGGEGKRRMNELLVGRVPILEGPIRLLLIEANQPTRRHFAHMTSSRAVSMFFVNMQLAEKWAHEEEHGGG